MKCQLTVVKLLQKAGAALFAKPVAVAPDGNHRRVVKQAVQYCRSDDRVPKNTSPFANGTI